MGQIDERNNKACPIQIGTDEKRRKCRRDGSDGRLKPKENEPKGDEKENGP